MAAEPKAEPKPGVDVGGRREAEVISISMAFGQCRLNWSFGTLHKKFSKYKYAYGAGHALHGASLSLME